MTGRWRTWLGWLALALAVAGLFGQAAALPAAGYGLRFAAPLSDSEQQALRRAAGDLGLDLALWREDAATLATANGRTAEARVVTVSGTPALAYPARYTAGTAPGAGQTGGCAVSTALADALYGSRAVTGLTLDLPGGARTITGVLAASEPLVLCPAAGVTACTAAELDALPARDPRGTVSSLLGQAALSGAARLPYGTLRMVLTALAWLPLAIAALRLVHRVWRCLPLAGGARWLAGLGLALAAAAALPALLGALPRWLIPSRWSDPAFWGDLGALAGETLQTFLHLPATARDAAFGTGLLGAAGCLLAMALGAGLLRAGDSPAAPDRS